MFGTDRLKYPRKACVFVGMAVIWGCSPGQSSPSSTAPQESLELPEAAPSPDSQIENKVLFSEEKTAFEAAVPSAAGFGGEWPEDPTALIIVKGMDLDGGMTISAFGAAIFEGDREQIRRYVTAGAADIKEAIWFCTPGQQPIRSSPAHLAINGIHMKRASNDLLQYVLEMGAEPDAKETSYSADRTGSLAVYQQRLLYHAVTSGDVELVKTVIHQPGIDIEEGAGRVGGNVTSPLFAAVLRGDLAAAKALLDEGADPNFGVRHADGTLGKSPLALARESQQRKITSQQRADWETIIRLLQERGAE